MKDASVFLDEVADNEIAIAVAQRAGKQLEAVLMLIVAQFLGCCLLPSDAVLSPLVSPASQRVLPGTSARS